MTWYPLGTGLTTPTSAEWDNHVANINHLGSMKVGTSALSTISAGTPIWGAGFAAWETSADQVVTAATPALMTFSNSDNPMGWWASNRFTIGAGGDGDYLFTFFASLAATPGYLELRLGGTNVARFNANIAGSTPIAGSVILHNLIATNFVELWVVASASPVTKLNRCAGFSAVKVG